jgi:PKD repeat protein
MRISIANAPAPIIPGTNLADGRGPASGYRLGETEDYYFEPTCPEPVADFDWDPATICPTTTVYFWDQSTGSPTSWSWDFDDGSAGSTAQNPTHVFPGVGTYDVTLTVSNTCGTDSITKQVVVVDCPDDEEEYDIWIKDSAADDGSVPQASPWWISPDIWVRNSDDNGTVHQNPVAGTTNYIYVKVRNRLTTPVENITVNVYWANAALGLTWPGSFNLANSFVVASLAGGGEVVQSVPWNTPYSIGHFCLRVRGDAPKDPIGSGPDTKVPVSYPPNNNNIAQKNLNVFNFPEVKECGFYTSTVYTEVVYFDAQNKDSPEQVDIVIDSSDFPLGGTGKIILDPGSLWGDWASLTNFVEVDSTLVPTAFPASMNDVQMAASETVRMTMTVGAEIDVAFTIDIEELIDDVSVGGIQYVRDMPRCVYLPVILKNLSP